MVQGQSGGIPRHLSPSVSVSTPILRGRGVRTADTPTLPSRDREAGVLRVLEKRCAPIQHPSNRRGTTY